MNTQKQLLETISRCTEHIRILCEENLNLKESNRLLQADFDYIEYRHNILLTSRLQDMANYSRAMANLEDEDADEDLVCGPPVRDVANYSSAGVKIEHQEENEEDLVCGPPIRDVANYSSAGVKIEHQEENEEDLVCGPPIRDVANYSSEGVKVALVVDLNDDMELEELDEQIEEYEYENEAEDEAMELDEEIICGPPVRDVANTREQG